MNQLVAESSNVKRHDPEQIEAKANILLVDDREDKRLAMETVLADLGQNIVRASSGRDALRCLLHQDFAVILLDVNMPGMDGFETALLIRQRRNSEHVPIIFVTAISDTETHVSRGYSLGAVDYILTPVVPEVLRAKVTVFVELFKATEQVKRQAERLRRAHDELEERVRQRTTELAIANDNIRKLNVDLERRVQDRTAQLVEANQELETFTYSIAHDLRAPLRQIHGYAHILGEEFVSNLPAEACQYFNRIGEKARNMEQMVDGLLNFFGIARQNFDRQRVDLSVIVHAAVAAMKPETQNRQIKWQIGDLPSVVCNVGLMKHVFTNLLSNAAKYTRPRDPAIIKIGQMKIDDEVVIYVQDNGVGFDMEYADKLFGVFQRLHRAEDFEGTGIGLALVSRIISKHGGRIWAQAKVGQGAAFYFTVGKE
jgi:signal transduction histidine kinase